MRYIAHRRRAFTLLELIIVIVVVGILAAVAVPRLNQNRTQEGADTVLSFFRYTQHLGLVDNKHSFYKRRWHRGFWKIAFGSCRNGDSFMMVGSDSDLDGNGFFEETEAAVDPVDGKPLFFVNGGDCDDPSKSAKSSPNVFIGKHFGVTSVSGSGGCKDVKYLGFDHLGRPHVGFGESTKPDYSSYMDKACEFEFGLKNGEKFKIHIEPESGSSWIVGQNNS